MGRVKGTVIIGIVKSLRFHDAKEFMPEEVHQYLGRRILESSWYDEQEYLKLILALGEVLRCRRDSVPELPPNAEIFRWLGRVGALNYWEGAYKNLLKRGDPGRTLKNYEILWRVRHDTGEAKVTLLGPEEAQVAVSGYCLASEEICRSITGNLSSMLEQAGAEDIDVEKRRCRAHGDDHCQWRSSWRNPAAA